MSAYKLKSIQNKKNHYQKLGKAVNNQVSSSLSDKKTSFRTLNKFLITPILGAILFGGSGGCVHHRFVSYRNTQEYSSQEEIQIVKDKKYNVSQWMPPRTLLNLMERDGLKPKIIRKSGEIPVDIELLKKFYGHLSYCYVPADAVERNILEVCLIFADNHAEIYGYTSLLTPGEELNPLNYPKLWKIVARIPNIDTSKPLKFYDVNYTGSVATLIFENGGEPEVARVIKDKEGNIKVERIKLLPEIQPLLDKTRIENLCVLTLEREDRRFTFVYDSKESFPFEMVLEIDGKGRKRFIPYKESKMFK